MSYSSTRIFRRGTSSKACSSFSAMFKKSVLIKADGIKKISGGTQYLGMRQDFPFRTIGPRTMGTKHITVRYAYHVSHYLSSAYIADT